MPILAAGNPSDGHRGFTLLELLVVLAIVAFVSAAVGFSMRDDVQTRLEREAVRLSALLEAGRARSQVSGVELRWRVLAQGFRFEGLSQAERDLDDLPQGWLDPDTEARITPASAINPAPATTLTAGTLVLGPEPIIAAQSVTLSSRSQPAKSMRLGTDGLRPFVVQLDAAP